MIPAGPGHRHLQCVPEGGHPDRSRRRRTTGSGRITTRRHSLVRRPSASPSTRWRAEQPWRFWRSPADQPRVGPPGAAHRHRPGRVSAYAWSINQAYLEPFYGGGGAQHVAEPAQLRLRRGRSRGRRSRSTSSRARSGSRRSRSASSGSTSGRSCCPRSSRACSPSSCCTAPCAGSPAPGAGLVAARGAGEQPGRDPARPRQHLRLAAHPVARAGRRRHRPRLPHRPVALAALGRRPGRPRLPGQDAAGLARGPRALPRLPGGRAGAPRSCGDVWHLAAATLAVAVVSLSWMSVVSLVPQSSRPYVDGSCNDSLFNQVFSYNGFSRLGGDGLRPRRGAAAPPPTSSR